MKSIVNENDLIPVYPKRTPTPQELEAEARARKTERILAWVVNIIVVLLVTAIVNILVEIGKGL